MSAAEYLAKEQNRKNYEIDDHNKEVVKALILYFMGHSEFEKTNVCKDPSLNKGILLAGQPGSGKTMLMRSFQYAKFKPFGFRYCIDIPDEVIEHGPQYLWPYGKKAAGVLNQKVFAKHILFDDLGSEEIIVKYFGTEINSFSRIILQRYIHFLKYKLMTHFTTHCSIDELEDFYGVHVISRLKQMCNFITLTGIDRRK